MEAMEDLKKSSEFWDLVAAAVVRGLVEGFYTCRGFRYPPLGCLEEAKAAQREDGLQVPNPEEEGILAEVGIPAEEEDLPLGNEEDLYAVDWADEDDNKDDNDDDEEEEKEEDD